MPELVKGRDRLDYKGDPRLLDMVKIAAHRQNESVSQWIRKAIEGLLREQGLEPPAPGPLPGFEPRRRRKTG